MASRFSSSTNDSRRRVCSYGNTAIVMTSRTPNNPGRMFWRCPNWKDNPRGHYFEWTDCEVDGESSVQPSMEAPTNTGDSKQFDEAGYWKKKCLKLREKVGDERERSMMLVFVLLITWVVGFGCITVCLLKCH
ncbi:hypothetical protein RIF29_35356 [Crotalaria pallida]|uniref:GRF-type domain-containing protein n=1 Tax=Crotalaria pallida TaxID=3830 RepID=A0AAN9HXW6_CROPI